MNGLGAQQHSKELMNLFWVTALSATAASSPSVSTAQLVARFADLPDLLVSETIANTIATRWRLVDNAVNDQPWLQETLKRADLIEGWCLAFQNCAVEPGKIGSRYENLKSILSYPPIMRKEAGHERELLNLIVKRCSATKTALPEGPCVRLARVVYPESKMAHLYDGLEVRGDGAMLVLPTKSEKTLKSREVQARADLLRLVGNAKSKR